MLLHQYLPLLTRSTATIHSFSIPSFAASLFTVMMHCEPISKNVPSMCKLWSGANPDHIKEAALALKQGFAVAFPTETVYGLGALAIDDDAVARIFAAKGRPSDNPLIVHVADGEAGLHRVALGGRPPEVALRLGKRFWPGPLSICIRANKDAVGNKARAGLDTVAIRVPDHPVALAILRELGGDVPVAAPSANASGRPSPTSAAHVLEDLGLGGRIAGVVDGGASECAVGIESTVVDCSTEQLVILRPGKITQAELEAFLGVAVAVHSPASVPPSPHTPTEGVAVAKAAGPKAPGMKYRHYAPRAPLRICRSVEALVEAAAAEVGGESRLAGVVGIMAPADVLDGPVAATLAHLPGWVGQRWGRHAEDWEGLGRELYGALRAFDALPDVRLILALGEERQALEEQGLGHAVMNRLHKAALAHCDETPTSDSHK